MTSAETAAADNGNLWHNTVRHRVDHFCAGADDAAPFGVLADHEAVHIVEKNQRNLVLIAVEDEAGGFFRGLRVNHAPKFNAFLIRSPGLRLHVFLLIGDDADGPAADARVTAQDGFAIFCAILFELTGIYDARDDFAHVVLLARIARIDAVDFLGREERVAYGYLAKDGSGSVAHFVDEGANAF